MITLSKPMFRKIFLKLWIALLLPAVGAAQDAPLLSAEEKIIIDADEVRCETNTEKCTAQGHAQVQRGDLILTADVIHIYGRKNAAGKQEIDSVEALHHVVLTTPTEKAQGTRAEYKRSEEKLSLYGDPVTIKREKESLAAHGSIVFWRLKNLIEAGENVSLTTEKHELTAQRMVANLASAGGKLTLDKVEALGGVKVATNQEGNKAPQWAQGDKGIYSAKEGRAFLQGHVQLQQGQSFAQGNEAEVNLTTGESTLRGMKKADTSSSKSQERVRVIIFPDSLKRGQEQHHGK